MLKTERFSASKFENVLREDTPRPPPPYKAPAFGTRNNAPRYKKPSYGPEKSNADYTVGDIYLTCPPLPNYLQSSFMLFVLFKKLEK